VKTHLISIGIVSIALFCMYSNDWIVAKGKRVYAELAPGGFVVSYYEDTEFRELVARRSQRRVVLNYGEGYPALGVPVNNHSARWEGWLHATESAKYVFFMQYQGGARLKIEGRTIIDKWDDHNWIPGAHGACWLSNGVYKVVIEHYKTAGPGAIRLRWAGGPVSGNTVMGVPHVYKKRKVAE
jgi:hypothetical protein